MLRILLGGSPCTYWSIIRVKGRETEAKGKGWELFKCYTKAKELYKPDYFLYENNWSISPLIKQQIERELGYPIQMINSALVSAQNRKRIYVTNIPNVQQPEDKGIKFSDIIDIDRKDIIGEPFQIAQRGVYIETMSRCVKVEGGITVQKYEPKLDDKSCTLTTVTKDVQVGMRVKDTSKDYTFIVKGGKTTAKREGIEKLYDINLEDGKYYVRNLSTDERKRLQTVPEDYKMLGNKAKDLRLLGNGWTIDIIKHILSNIPNIKNEEVEVLSMFDGMACGRIALEELGVNVVRYMASEIDEYAIKTAILNYPNIEEIGDAFNIEQILKKA